MRAAARLAVACVSLSLTTLPVSAQSAENVAVVINEASPASVRIGEHYARIRNLPPLNVIRIKTEADEEISRRQFESTIEAPITRALARNALHDRVLYVVLTKGIPLKIAGTDGLDGTTASVDSELTLLYRKMTGVTVPSRGSVDNPYYQGTADVAAAQRFTHRAYDIYLVSRLDAFTIEEALALIDRAQAASTEGRVVLDQRATAEGVIGDKWLRSAAERLESLGFGDRISLDATPAASRGIRPVLGYYSWGSNDPANRVRRVEMGFSPGALAATFVSTDARTLQAPPDPWVPSAGKAPFGGSSQSLVGDLIREGATGVAGQVAEPYLQSTVRPEILFPAYLSGFNLLESFYLAMPHLSWQTVVIGDPLCAPFVRKTLAPSGIEEPIDSKTELPGIFARRRLGVVQRGSSVPQEALMGVLLAEARLARDDKTGARSALEGATRLAPGLVSAQLRLAGLYEEGREFGMAANRYTLVLEIQPNNVVALNNLAFILAVRQGAPGDGKPLAVKAVALAAADPIIIDTLAWIEHLLGNDAEAIRLLGPAVQKSVENPEIHLHAAAIYAALSRQTLAAGQLAEALRLDPELAHREDVKALRRQIDAMKGPDRSAKTVS